MNKKVLTKTVLVMLIYRKFPAHNLNDNLIGSLCKVFLAKMSWHR